MHRDSQRRCVCCGPVLLILLQCVMLLPAGSIHSAGWSAKPLKPKFVPQHTVIKNPRQSDREPEDTRESLVDTAARIEEEDNSDCNDLDLLWASTQRADRSEGMQSGAGSFGLRNIVRAEAHAQRSLRTPPARKNTIDGMEGLTVDELQHMAALTGGYHAAAGRYEEEDKLPRSAHAGDGARRERERERERHRQGATGNVASRNAPTRK